MIARFAYALATLGSALWLSVQIHDLRRASAPGTDWIEVRGIHVYDGWAGEPNIISYDREIKRPFFGRFVTLVRPITQDSDGCLPMEGSVAYRVMAPLPPAIDLDWWTHPSKCRLSPGKYRLETTWRIEAEGYPPKQLHADSNVFEVHPLPEEIKRLRSSP